MRILQPWLLLAGFALAAQAAERSAAPGVPLTAPAATDQAGAFRPRVVISTDFPPTNVVMRGAPAHQCSDPDDVQSMVRFLLHANEFDVEGLVASSGTFANIANKANLLDMLNLYAMVDENLRKHDPRYPTADQLRAVTCQGLTGTYGKSVSNNIGAGKDSEASEAIIKIVDKPDARPVWFCVWGDCANIAQAIWKVQSTRSAAEVRTFLGKIRIHQIARQDESIDWLLKSFPDLFIIYSRTTYQGMFGGSDPSSDLAWVNTNIRHNHGPLGAVYPPAGMGCSGVCEGDSPSFLHLVSAVRGLNNPEDPTQPSWGGQFKRDGSTRHYLDGPGRSSVSKWRAEFQHDFAARMDWCVADDYKKANHNPVAALNGDTTKRVIELTAKPGETVTLSAAGTRDPDGDAFEVRWWIYPEASTLRDARARQFPTEVKLSSTNGLTTRLTVPAAKQPATIHIILEVQDRGTPSLWAYRRAVVTIRP